MEMEGRSVDTILKGTHPRTIPATFSLIWLRGFRGEDLNVKVYDGQTDDDGRQVMLLKIEISSIVYCCFIINLNELKFLMQLHGNE
jgi:hypothetical protein